MKTFIYLVLRGLIYLTLFLGASYIYFGGSIVLPELETLIHGAIIFIAIDLVYRLAQVFIYKQLSRYYNKKADKAIKDLEEMLVKLAEHENRNIDIS